MHFGHVSISSRDKQSILQLADGIEFFMTEIKIISSLHSTQYIVKGGGTSK